jgi:hypothetical protein
VTTPQPRPLWTLAAPALGALQAAYLLTTLLPPMGQVVQRDLQSSSVAPIGYVVCVVAGTAAGFFLVRRLPIAVLPAGALLALIGLPVEAFASSAGFLLVGTLINGLGGGVLVGSAVRLAAAKPVLAGLGGALVLSWGIGWVATFVITTMFSWRLAFLAALPVALLVLAGCVVGEVVLLVRRR